MSAGSGRLSVGDRPALSSSRAADGVPRRYFFVVLVVLMVVSLQGLSIDQWEVLDTIQLLFGIFALGICLVFVKRRCIDLPSSTTPPKNRSIFVRIRQLLSRRLARRILLLLLVIVVLVYILVFRILAEELGYRPPSVPPQVRSSAKNDELLTVFLIDGLRADIFEEELKAGNLPSMQALADTGCRVNSVMATFPSITGYAYWPLMTGIDATRSGHLGTRYLDRRLDAGNWRNHYGPGSAHFEPGFEPSVSTLFEASKGWTLAGGSMLKRGANVTYTASTEQYFTKISHKWWLPKVLRKIPILKWVAPNFMQYETRYLRRILKILKQGNPRVAWIVFASTDNVAHAFGVHDEYRTVLRAIDHSIGMYVKAVQAEHYRTTFAVVSDHGEASVDIPGGGNLDLCEAFIDKGVRAWRGDAKAWSGKFDEPLDAFGADKDILIGIQGDTAASVYVKSDAGWKERTFEKELRTFQASDGSTVDLVQTALAFRGVELVAWSRENGVVAVQTTSDGSEDTSAIGLIHLERDGRISYRHDGATRDNTGHRCPLGYGPALADGRPRSAREWLEVTNESPFPYALIRLIQCFTVPGLSPDMIVTAQGGFDFGKEWEYFILNFAGGHGGINPFHLKTTAIFSGSGVKNGKTVQQATAEDIGASLHRLLGSPHSTPSLQFLKGRKEEDMIAKAYFDPSTRDENYAEQLLRGTPLSCVSPPSS